MVYTQIAIVNQSTVITDANGSILTSALNQVLPTFCNDWNLPLVTAIYVGLGKTTTTPLKVFLMDTSDVSGALGYHDELNNLPYGKCFAKTVLSYGTLLWSATPSVPTFAQTVCHEVFEMLIDLYCNSWAMLADNKTLYAYEVCDPVESNALTVTVTTSSTTSTKSSIPPFKVTTSTTTTSTNVGLSDWILPQWFNPQATRGPFNHNNTLTAPFQLSPNGYVIKTKSGTISYVFGESVNEEHKARILAKGRVVKRG